MFDHHFTPDNMAYVSISRGFKSGNIGTTSLVAFQPETITAYEIGMKSDLLERRLRLNAAAYYYDYKDLQLSSFEDTTIVTRNAASATDAGFELNADAVVTDYFNVNFNTIYMYSEFKNYDTAACYVPNSVPPGGDTLVTPCNLSGTRLPHTPKFSFNISPQYILHTNWGNLTTNVTYSYTSSYLWEPGVTVTQPAYGLLSARVTLATPNPHFAFALWGKNLTQQQYAVWGVGQSYGNYISPGFKRTYGAEVDYHF
jgi:iron complex outermembrane receptor protein